MVVANVGEETERGHAQNAQQGMVDQYFPPADSWWDPNNLAQTIIDSISKLSYVWDKACHSKCCRHIIVIPSGSRRR